MVTSVNFRKTRHLCIVRGRKQGKNPAAYVRSWSMKDCISPGQKFNFVLLTKVRGCGEVVRLCPYALFQELSPIVAPELAARGIRSPICRSRCKRGGLCSYTCESACLFCRLGQLRMWRTNTSTDCFRASAKGTGGWKGPASRPTGIAAAPDVRGDYVRSSLHATLGSFCTPFAHEIGAQS